MKRILTVFAVLGVLAALSAAHLVTAEDYGQMPKEKPDKVLMKALGWTEKEIGETTVYKADTGSKCKTCIGVGYKGRRAVCETLYFTEKIRHLIAESGDDIDEQAIREAGRKDGMLTLMDSAKRLVDMGETTVEEMLRVVGAE